MFVFPRNPVDGQYFTPKRGAPYIYSNGRWSLPRGRTAPTIEPMAELPVPQAASGFDFPDSPIEGQIFYSPFGTSYIYVSPVWRILYNATGGGSGGGSSSITVDDDPPTSPNAGDMWWESDTGALWLWYADADSAQWVQVNGGGGGSGGGGGDDLDTTPVAATDSTLERVVPDWLAGAPIFEAPGDVLLTPEHRGAWLHMLNDVGSLVILPDYWLPGMAVGVRQIGIGQVQWQITGGSTMQMPITRADHVGISEQYEEIICRVIANSDGTHAVWGIQGSTF